MQREFVNMAVTNVVMRPRNFERCVALWVRCKFFCLMYYVFTYSSFSKTHSHSSISRERNEQKLWSYFRFNSTP